MMRVLDLFSGIGGFSLGLERTGGFKTVAFCEIEPYCQAVLRKHWPEVPVYDDVRTLTVGRLAADGIEPDVICGGFPCQDISVAGAGAGIEGERSGLWREYARLIGEFRPRFVIVENVAALLSRGMDTVLGDLAALRYDAEWHCIPASAVGAPHRRDRVWIVAYPIVINDDHGRYGAGAVRRNGQAPAKLPGRKGSLADASRFQPGREEQRPQLERIGAGGQPQSISNALSHQLWQQSGRWDGAGWPGEAQPGGDGAAWPLADTDVLGQQIRINVGRGEGEEGRASPWREIVEQGWWLTEPDVGRVAHGVPARVDRLRCLGNAVVPQIPEIIGRAILASARQQGEEDRRSDTAFPQAIQQPDTNNSSRRIA